MNFINFVKIIFTAEHTGMPLRPLCPFQCLTLQPLQEVRAEDFQHVIEWEAFQVDAGVQHLYQRARLELGKPC